MTEAIYLKVSEKTEAAKKAGRLVSVSGMLKFLGISRMAMQAGNTRLGHWFATHTVAVNMAMTKERLINSGFYDLATAYQFVHVNY